MNRVRVLAGTKKGAFILTSDEARRRWQIEGPFFGGWEVYHVAGSPADPDRLYASQTSEWFGQIIQRSSDGGRTWEQPGNESGEEPGMNPDGTMKGASNRFIYDTSEETGASLTDHQWYDGSLKPWVFKRVWHLEPSFDDPDTLLAGVEDAALFRSTDGGVSWHEVSGNLPTDFGFAIDVHAHDPDTVYVVPIKSDMEHYPPDGRLRVYRSRKGGDGWEELGRGLPERHCYVNVLRDAMAIYSLDDCGVYFGTTGGQIYCSPDSGEHWQAIAEHLPPVLSVEVQTLK